MDKAPLPPIHFFRPGVHTAMSGQSIEFSAADLAAAAAAYDPAKWQAPIVVGHPAIDAPAYGWVEAVRDEAGQLYADAGQVEAQFADMVRAGRFKKVSAAWFMPEHPRNPTPGSYYLKHIGFLGAAAPAVSGLKPVEFAADAADVLIVSFAGEYDDSVNAGLWRSLREWFIGKFGLDEADKIVPGYSVATLEDAARQEIAEAPATNSVVPMPVYADPIQPKETQVTPEEKAAIEAQNAALASELAALKAEKAAADRLALHAENAAFADGLVRAGRLVPGIAPLIVATLDHLAATEAPAFGEGDAAQPLPAALKAALSAAPVVVDFAERGADRPGDAPAESMSREAFDSLTPEQRMTKALAGVRING
jgi:hypothetical protein